MRRDILERRPSIEEWIGENRSKAFMCRELRCKPLTLEGYLKKFGIIYAGNQGGKGKSARIVKVRATFYTKAAISKVIF